MNSFPQLPSIAISINWTLLRLAHPPNHHARPKAGRNEMLYVVPDVPGDSLSLLPTDWTLLNANLQFLFLDPVLTVHMKEQADGLIGRSLLEFVHPDERQDASIDLHDVVEKHALHGTVTRQDSLQKYPLAIVFDHPPSSRVKYVRASYIRVLLGASTRDSFPHAKQIGYDDKYLPCDIVINWVAENLVLCFLHAIIGAPYGASAHKFGLSTSLDRPLSSR